MSVVYLWGLWSYGVAGVWFSGQVGRALNAQPPQFHIHVRLLDVLMGKSTFLQRKYVFFAPAALDTIPEQSSMSVWWMEAVQTSELCIYRSSYNWFIHLLFPCSLHKEYIGKRSPQSHFCSRNEVLEGAGGVQVHCWCYRRCWRSRAAAGRAGARNSRQDFLPFSPAHRALLPLMLFPNLPPAAFGRKQMELCRLWGTMPHQAWPLHVLGQR